jgi:hypothetical protein
MKAAAMVQRPGVRGVPAIRTGTAAMWCGETSLKGCIHMASLAGTSRHEFLSLVRKDFDQQRQDFSPTGLSRP